MKLEIGKGKQVRKTLKTWGNNCYTINIDLSQGEKHEKRYTLMNMACMLTDYYMSVSEQHTCPGDVNDHT